MTPATLAARVAAECGPLNDTERERARRLALEHQMAAVAESFDRAELRRTGKVDRSRPRPPPQRSYKQPSPCTDRAIATLRQNPGATTKQLMWLAGVSRTVAQRVISAERIANADLTNGERVSE